MDVKNLVNEMNGMIMQGKLLDAFEEFYDENVVMQENNEEPRVGKDANREYEKKFVDSISEFHGANIEAVGVDEDNNKTLVQWEMDVTFKGGERKKMKQVAVQQWENGKIIREQFYYDPR